MPPRHRAPARSRTWMRPLGVALVALVVATSLFVAGVVGGGLHEWLALAAPPIAYLVVGIGMWRRTPLQARLKWAGLTYAVYLALGVALAAVFVSIRGDGLAAALALVFWDFGPALAILMLAAPLMLPRPREVTRWLGTREPYVSRRARLVPPPIVSVGDRATLSFPAEDPLAKAPHTFIPVVVAAPPPPLDEATQPVEVPLLEADRAEEAERVEEAEAPIDSEPVHVDGELPIRIPFARIAAQLPQEGFVLPPDRLAASLREPNYLLLPLRLILPQLAEGSVEIAWALVDEQFPELAFAEQLAEFQTRFPELRLTLPIDEIVQQLPPEVFRIAAPGTDLHAIESFPPPFQPFVTRMEAGATVSAELARFLQHDREAAPTPAAPEIEKAAVGAETPGEEIVQEDAVRAEAPAPPVGEPALAPVASAPASVPRAPEPVRDPGPSPEALAAARRIAACLSPAGSFEVLTRRVGERLALAFVAPGLDADKVFGVAADVAPLVAAEGAELATLRSPRGTLVVSGTRVADEDALVVAAVGLRAPLALLEILMLRAVSADPIARDGAPAPTASLRAADGEAARRLARLGAGPAGFGRVTPAAFVDGASGVSVYVFQAHGHEAGQLGDLASRVHAALSAGEWDGTGSLTFRHGRRRTVVRLVGEVPSGRAVVAASGTVTLAGLAGREVERVALALEAA